MKKLLVEFIGTFFLVFTIGTAITAKTAIPGLAIGSVLMVMIYAGGHISGAHYNPAVSLAVYLRGKMKGGEMIQYWIVQLVGGLLGAIISYYITGNNPDAIHHAPGIGYYLHSNNPDAQNVDGSSLIPLAAEFFGTFALAYVVLNVATSKNTAGNSFYGMAIGFTVFSMAASLGGISGGAFNPAVGLGRNVAEMILEGTMVSAFWIYIVGPLAGGALAGFTFNMLNPEDR